MTMDMIDLMPAPAAAEASGHHANVADVLDEIDAALARVNAEAARSADAAVAPLLAALPAIDATLSAEVEARCRPVVLDVEYMVGLKGIERDVRTLLQRWLRAFVIEERVTRQLLATLPADKARRRDGEGAADARETARRAADDPASVMVRKGQLSPRLYIAWREVEKLLERVKQAEGLRSGLANLGERVDGGGGAGQGLVVFLDSTQRWADVTRAIMCDPRSGAEEHRVHVVETLRRVCGGQSIADLARTGELGRRAVIAKRLTRGLTVAADEIGIGRDRRASRVVHDEAVVCDVEMAES